jgi:hypothetical protein
MSNKTLIMVGVAGVVGIAVVLYLRKAHAAGLATVPGRVPVPAPYVPAFVQATPAQILAGAYQSAPGESWHIPKAVRTPAQEIAAAAAELRANTGASHF